MPLVTITVSQAVDNETADMLMARTTERLSAVTDKDQDYFMVLVGRAHGSMGGVRKSVAFVEVRGIGGLHDAVNERISAAMCALLQETLGIPPDCVYLNFVNVRGYNWGWNGRTFG